MTLDEQVAYLIKGCVDVVREQELRAKLERFAQTGKPLVVKVGFDPTAPDLHLGHTVLIRKMKHFQDLGHTVIFLIGDFTGLIGDPTGRSKTRPPLSREDIERNADTYRQQIFKLLNPETTIVDFNSRWLSPLGSEGWIRLAARYNVAQMLERREFRQRFDARQPIAVHEFLYPLGQAYDSVFLRADVELGGTDQLFNLNVGRDIMPSYGLEAQVVMTTPLLVGLDGVEKMSKSLGNYVAVTDAPSEMFGKVMSISDDLMWSYYELLTDITREHIAALRADVREGRVHPRRAKADLAKLIVADFHDQAAADAAEAEFDRVHAHKELPKDMPSRTVEFPLEGKAWSKVLFDAGLVKSAAEGARRLTEGGVTVDGERLASPDPTNPFRPTRPDFILQMGRRAVRVQVRPDDQTRALLMSYKNEKSDAARKVEEQIRKSTILAAVLQPAFLEAGQAVTDSVDVWNQTPLYHPLYLTFLDYPEWVLWFDRQLARMQKLVTTNRWNSMVRELHERPLGVIFELNIYGLLADHLEESPVRPQPELGNRVPDISVEFEGFPCYLECTVLREGDFWQSVHERMQAQGKDVFVTSGPGPEHEAKRIARKLAEKWKKALEGAPNVLCLCVFDPSPSDFALELVLKSLEPSGDRAWLNVDFSGWERVDSILVFSRQRLNRPFVNQEAASTSTLKNADREAIMRAVSIENLRIR